MYEVRAGSTVVTNLLFHFISFYHILSLVLILYVSLPFVLLFNAFLSCHSLLLYHLSLIQVNVPEFKFKR